MTEEERDRLRARWQELNDALDGLAEGRVQPGAVDLAKREEELNTELDEVEYRLGLDDLERRRREVDQ